MEIDVEINSDDGRVVGEFTIPLIHGNGQTSELVTRESYSEIYKLNVRYELAIGEGESYLAVERSKFELRVVTAPGLRYEFERNYTSAPTAHIHLAGVTGLLSVALMANYAGRKQKGKRRGEMAELHLPVGGRRFRPSLEEFLFFIIAECGFQGRPGWESRLLAAREEWLDIQLRAAVHDHAAIAADTLRGLGYEVTPPTDETYKNRKLSW